jgi:hypothetical protein
MHALRSWFVVVGLASFLVLGPSVLVAREEPAEEKWLLDWSLTLSPAPQPVPALKYRLFPLASELKEGNAVPIYLRLVHSKNDAARKEWYNTPLKWDELPLEQIPLAEAKEFLQRHRQMLQQLDLGARRKHADWNYTTDQGRVIEILLPDMQSLRTYVPPLLLRARVEIAEGSYAAATYTLQTGFALGRHASESDFLIGGLVGVALESIFMGAVRELMQRPDAPNLYWALSALPRPLIDLRREMEFDQHFFLQTELPDLADLDRQRAPGQWDAALKTVRTKLRQFHEGLKKAPDTRPNTGPDDPASKSPDLTAARTFLTERLHVPADQVAQMLPAELLVRYIGGQLRVSLDDTLKATYLPYPEARPVLAASRRLLEKEPDTEAVLIVRGLLPAIQKVEMAQNRLERLIASLRVVEALRMHAAATGRLPEKLDDITVVPVPHDPGTWQPFEYRKEGEAAVLSSRIPGESIALSGLRYRLTLRKG